MKPKNISDFVSLSEISNNNSDLLLKSTKMNLDKNSYESSIWKFSQNQWRELKQSSYWNFSAPKYSNNKKSFAFIKTPKSTEILDKLEKKKKLEKNKLIFRNRGKEKIVFETVTLIFLFSIGMKSFLPFIFFPSLTTANAIDLLRFGLK